MAAIGLDGRTYRRRPPVTDLWIVVPNWEKFQHYKDRNPVWMKLYFELNSRDDWRQLSYPQRGVLVSVWLEFGRSNGLLRLTSLGGRLGKWFKNETLEALIQAGYIELSSSKPLALTRSRETEEEPSKEGSSQREAPRPPLESGESPNGEIERDPEAAAKARALMDEVFGNA